MAQRIAAGSSVARRDRSRPQIPRVPGSQRFCQISTRQVSIPPPTPHPPRLMLLRDPPLLLQGPSASLPSFRANTADRCSFGSPNRWPPALTCAYALAAFSTWSVWGPQNGLPRRRGGAAIVSTAGDSGYPVGYIYALT